MTPNPDPEPETWPPNRWETDDCLPEDFVDADALDAPEAQALACRYGLDEILPAQATAPGWRVRALVLDTGASAGWELNSLEYTAGEGWWALAVYPPSEDRRGVARAAAWLLAHGSPLAS